jgi:hypothetical protein
VSIEKPDGIFLELLDELFCRGELLGRRGVRGFGILAHPRYQIDQVSLGLIRVRRMCGGPSLGLFGPRL